MNTLSLLFKRDPQKFLGRWTIEYCQTILHTKVRLANEDHCGTCYSTAIVRQLEKQTNNRVKEFKTRTTAMRRYNEYINVAIRDRKLVQKPTPTPSVPPSLETQIEYYICMH